MSSLHTANLVFEGKIRGHLPVTRLAVSDSGSIMIAVPDAHQPRLYHLMRIAAAGGVDEIGAFSVETLRHIDFSEDGRAFVAATDDDVYVFRDDKKTRFFPGTRDNYTAVSISASGELFAVGSADMILSSYSITLARTSGGTVWIKDCPFSVTSIRVTADASKILAGSDDGAAVMLDNSRSVIWQLQDDDPISAVAVSQSGEVSVLGTKGGAVRAVDAEGNRLWETVGAGPVVDCAITDDSELIAVARKTPAGSGLVEFLLADGTSMLEHRVVSQVVSVACSRSGRFGAISCEDGTVQILELTLAPARARSTEMVKTLYDEGCAAIEEGDHAGALERFTKLLEFCPSHVDACRKLVEVRSVLVRRHVEEAERLASEGALAESVQELRAAAAMCPYDRDVFERLTTSRERLISDSLARAVSSADAGQLEEALARVEEVLQLDFTHVQAREELDRLENALVAKYTADADAALETGRPAEAVQILEKAAALRPSPQVRELLAKARAREALKQGLALYEAQKYSQAAFQFRKVLSIDPDNAEAQKYIEYAESLRQDDMLFDRFSKLE